MSPDADRSQRVRPPSEPAGVPNANGRRWGVGAAVVVSLAAAAVSALGALWCLVAGLFGDLAVVGGLAFALSALTSCASAILTTTPRWARASWLSSCALVSTVVATSAVAGHYTSFGWGLAMAVGASSCASAAVLLLSAVSAGPGGPGWSPVVVALGVVAASFVALLNPTPRPLPTDASHARDFVEAYQRELMVTIQEASEGRLAGTTTDGLISLPKSLCHLAARCEVQLVYLSTGYVLFVPTYISWRNEYAGGLIRWTADGPPPAVDAFTAKVTPKQEVGEGWWWSEPG